MSSALGLKAGAERKSSQSAKKAGWCALFPRLLTAVLRFSSSKDIVSATAACKAWVLPTELSNSLWRTVYEAAWENDTGTHPKIANDGDQTLWITRFRRRQQTERNFRAGKFRSANLPFFETDTRIFDAVQDGQYMVFSTARTGDVALFKMNANFALEHIETKHVTMDSQVVLALSGNILVMHGYHDIRVWQLPELKLLRTMPIETMGLAAHRLATDGKNYIIAADYGIFKLDDLTKSTTTVDMSAAVEARTYLTPWEEGHERHGMLARFDSDVVYTVLHSNHQLSLVATKISTGEDLFWTQIKGGLNMTYDALYDRMLCTYLSRLAGRAFKPRDMENMETMDDNMCSIAINAGNAHDDLKLQCRRDLLVGFYRNSNGFCILDRATLQRVSKFSIAKKDRIGHMFATPLTLIVAKDAIKDGLPLLELDFTPV